MNAHDPSLESHDSYDYGGSPNWFTRLLWYSAGADGQLLRRCPQSDQVKYQCLGGVVLATALLAMVSGSYAFYIVFGPKAGNALTDQALAPEALAIALGFGLGWALIIFNIDRFIVAATGKGDGTERITLTELISALPRIFMATVIGLCLSAPLEVRILKTEIDTELASRQKAERQRLDKATDARTEKDKAELHGKIEKARARLDGRGSEYEKRRQEILSQRHTLELEAEGATASGKAGRGPAWRDKKENLDRLEKELEDWKGHTKTQDEPVVADIAQWRKDLERIAAEVQTEKAENQRAAAKMDGLMMRIHISHEIGGWVPILIMLLLLSIEVGPIFFKLMLVTGAYDYLQENQKALAAARYGIEPATQRFVDGRLMTFEPRFHAAETVLTASRSRLQHEAQLTEQVHAAWRARLEPEIAAAPERFVIGADGLTGDGAAFGVEDGEEAATATVEGA